jgi:hypothetical protein
MAKLGGHFRMRLMHLFPKSVPVFTADDIIEPPPKEYEEGNKKSFLGWLKHLFLFHEPEPGYLQIRPEDRQNFEKVLDIVRKECKIKEPGEWEETATRKKQATVLNKICRKLGYVQIEEI